MTETRSKKSRFSLMIVSGLGIVFLIASMGVVVINLSNLQLEQIDADSSQNSFAIVQCEQGQCKRGFFVAFEKKGDSSEARDIEMTTLVPMALERLSSILSNSKEIGIRTGVFRFEHLGACNNILRDRPETLLDIVVQPPRRACLAWQDMSLPQSDKISKCFFRINALSTLSSYSAYMQELLPWEVAAFRR